MKLKKIKLPIPNRVLVGFSLLIIGTILGITVTTVPILAGFTLPKLAFLTSKISQYTPQQSAKIDASVEKKQKLENFYKELTGAESKQDFEKLYSFVNPLDKKWFSLEDLTLIYKENKPFSIEYIVHKFDISGDVGSIDRTVVTCLNKDCTGTNKKEERGIKEVVYVDGQWYQQAKKEPSEKARQLTAYMYTNSDSAKKKELANRYGGGVDDFKKIIRTWSIILENDAELMAYDEALVANHKANASRPVINVESPQQPATVINQPAPVIQQPSYPRNCTSNSIGNYTYTNCY